MKTLWLELTKKCNFTCLHCYAGSSPSENLNGYMEQSDWQNVLAEARKIGFEGVQFIGGEPVLVPYLTDLINYTKELGFKFFEVYSNFSLKLDFDYFVKKGVNLATSFYSSDENVHKAITKNNRSFDKIVKNITLAIEKNIDLRVAIIVMDENRGHVDQTISFLKELGVEKVRTDFVRKIGRAGENNLQQNEISVVERELCGACGVDNLMINSNGDVFPCIMSTHQLLGNVLKNKKIVRDSRNQIEIKAFYSDT